MVAIVFWKILDLGVQFIPLILAHETKLPDSHIIYITEVSMSSRSARFSKKEKKKMAIFKEGDEGEWKWGNGTASGTFTDKIPICGEDAQTTL